MATRFITPSQVAARMGGMSDKDVRRLIRGGVIPAVELIVRGSGGRPRLLVKEEDFETFAASLAPARTTEHASRITACARQKSRPRRASSPTIVKQFV